MYTYENDHHNSIYKQNIEYSIDPNLYTLPLTISANFRYFIFCFFFC